MVEIDERNERNRPEPEGANMTNKEILSFDGTVEELSGVLETLKLTMPKGAAFVHNATGEIVNRVSVEVKRLSDGSFVWDVELYAAAR
jgi:hypothetical protein